MSKVQRYSRGFNGEMTKDPFGAWVLVGDAAEREKATQSELAALREEIERRAADWQALNHEFDNVNKRLADAEQQNAELVGALKEIITRCNAGWSCNAIGLIAEEALEDAALKPTESGASE